ncbi:MAG: ATPase, partial [Spirochaetales bacterium]|nr:ATPase [Spirochaetales bacterium]
LATVAIAQSFNAMASGLLRGFALPAGIIVLLIGHGLNLAMGLLSVMVHGVRLNLLEFSGQLGMEWTGIRYQPFAETVEE